MIPLNEAQIARLREGDEILVADRVGTSLPPRGAPVQFLSVNERGRISVMYRGATIRGLGMTRFSLPEGIIGAPAQRARTLPRQQGYMQQRETLTPPSEQTSEQRAEKAEKRLSALLVALEQEAKDRDWCEDYDEFMERNGFEGRVIERPFDVEFSVHLRFTMSRTGRTADAVGHEAREFSQNSQQAFLMALQTMPRTDIDLVEVLVEDVRE